MSTKKGRGLSLDEKRKRLCELFYEKVCIGAFLQKDFFQLKDLEKMAPKLKGIISQSVKEVLQSLVDDNLVCCEKIGTSNYYWSFPSTAIQTRKNQINRLEQDIERTRASIDELKQKIEKITVGREQTETYLKALEEYTQLEGENKRLLGEIDKYRETDPQLFNAKKLETEEIKRRINIWTGTGLLLIIDNIFTIQSYCSSNYGIAGADFSTQFGIPEDLDYV